MISDPHVVGQHVYTVLDCMGNCCMTMCSIIVFWIQYMSCPFNYASDLMFYL